MILAIFFALIILLLLAPIRLIISYHDEHFKATLHIAGLLRFNLAGGDKKPRTEKKHKKESAPKKPKPEKPKKSLQTYLQPALLTDILDTVGTILRSIRKNITIARFNLSLIIADKNAAVTALTYGSVCALAAPLLALLARKANIKRQSIHIAPDFETPGHKLDFETHITTNLGHLILIAFTALKAFATLKQKHPDVFH